MVDILMPKATAVWLVDNTSLTFAQIADFCGLHPLEVKGIADGDVAASVRGLDPIGGGQLTRDEIEKAEADSDYRMKVLQPKHAEMMAHKRKGPRYTPVSRRQDRPDAIAWMLRNHPEVPDSQISKLIGTTKNTIVAVRDRTHWNANQIKPVDPVTLGLCTQIDLDAVVSKAAEKARKQLEKDRKAGKITDEEADALSPTQDAATAEPEVLPERTGPAPDADSVFAAFSDLGKTKTDGE